MREIDRMMDELHAQLVHLYGSELDLKLAKFPERRAEIMWAAGIAQANAALNAAMPTFNEMAAAMALASRAGFSLEDATRANIANLQKRNGVSILHTEQPASTRGTL